MGGKRERVSDPVFYLWARCRLGKFHTDPRGTSFLEDGHRSWCGIFETEKRVPAWSRVQRRVNTGAAGRPRGCRLVRARRPAVGRPRLCIRDRGQGGTHSAPPARPRAGSPCRVGNARSSSRGRLQKPRRSRPTPARREALRGGFLRPRGDDRHGHPRAAGGQASEPGNLGGSQAFATSAGRAPRAAGHRLPTNHSGRPATAAPSGARGAPGVGLSAAGGRGGPRAPAPHRWRRAASAGERPGPAGGRPADGDGLGRGRHPRRPGQSRRPPAVQPRGSLSRGRAWPRAGPRPTERRSALRPPRPARPPGSAHVPAARLRFAPLCCGAGPRRARGSPQRPPRRPRAGDSPGPAPAPWRLRPGPRVPDVRARASGAALQTAAARGGGARGERTAARDLPPAVPRGDAAPRCAVGTPGRDPGSQPLSLRHRPWRTCPDTAPPRFPRLAAIYRFD